MSGPPSNLWTSVIGGDENFNTALSYVQYGMTTGVEYKFRVRDSNIFGWSEFSYEVTIRADEVPAQITPVTTTIETLNARIAWSIPSTDNGSPLLEYRVFVQHSDGLTTS